MLSGSLNKLLARFSGNNQRSLVTNRNLLASFVIKAFSLPISYILVPLTISYVDTDSYGVWLAVSSIVAWMNFFDIGINNGLRNKLAESIANGDKVLSRKYISTTYAFLIVISTACLILFSIANCFLDWSKILNTTPLLSSELSQVAFIVVGYFCFKFVLSTVNIVLLADQKAAAAAFRGFIEQLSSLICIFFLVKFTEGSLLNLALGLCIAPAIILLYFNFYLFFRSYRELAPSLNFVDFSVLKDLMSLGAKFFIIQIAGVVQFESANFIIIHYYGATDVAVYNIVFKYFSILIVLMGILLAPFWSAVTDAYVKSDYDWIISSEKKYKKIAIMLSLVGLIMLIFSDFLYGLWLGEKAVEIPFSTSFFMYIFVLVTIFGSVYCMILNGISALSIQYKASLVSPVIFIALSLVFIKYFELGLNSLILASIISNFNAYILAPVQYASIFKKHKKI